MTDRNKTVLVRGGTASLQQAVVTSLRDNGANVALLSSNAQSREMAGSVFADVSERLLVLDGDQGVGLPTQLAHVHAHFGCLDALANLFVPDQGITAEQLMDYPVELAQAVEQTADFMVENQIEGMIINQFLMTTIYAGHPLAAYAAAARGAVTGITRTACVRWGKAGVRVTGLFVGLLDLPELKQLASPQALAATTPLGRWISAPDVAETINFLALESGYITGQMLVLDGGMTSGINGV